MIVVNSPRAQYDQLRKLPQGGKGRAVATIPSTTGPPLLARSLAYSAVETANMRDSVASGGRHSPAKWNDLSKIISFMREEGRY